MEKKESSEETKGRQDQEPEQKEGRNFKLRVKDFLTIFTILLGLLYVQNVCWDRR